MTSRTTLTSLSLSVVSIDYSNYPQIAVRLSLCTKRVMYHYSWHDTDCWMFWLTQRALLCVLPVVPGKLSKRHLVGCLSIRLLCGNDLNGGIFFPEILAVVSDSEWARCLSPLDTHNCLCQLLFALLGLVIGVHVRAHLFASDYVRRDQTAPSWSVCQSQNNAVCSPSLLWLLIFILWVRSTLAAFINDSPLTAT